MNQATNQATHFVPEPPSLSTPLGGDRPNSLTRSRVCTWFLEGPLRPNERVRQAPVCAQPFLIGRKAGVTFCLPYDTVSSRHAELVIQGDTLLVRDLQSTNGTFINAARISGAVEVKHGDIVQFADVPFRILKQRPSTSSSTVSCDSFDGALALVGFQRLMESEGVAPHFQAVVRLADDAPIGYEALGRSSIPGLTHPGTMFAAAEQLGAAVRLSRLLRVKAMELSRRLTPHPHVFLNTHPEELTQSGLLESLAELRQQFPQQPITLEIHEAAISDVAGMKSLRDSLRELQIGLAFDDFGAGQARFAELCAATPDYLKFDISLIRGIDSSTPEHQRMVQSIVKMTLDIGAAPLAEGVETAGEAEKCRELGFQFAQGFYFGRPAPL